MRDRIEDDARLVPECELPGLGGGQIDRHVDVVQIEKRNDACARIDDLSGLRIMYCTLPLRGATSFSRPGSPRSDPLRPGRCDRKLRRITLRFGGVKSASVAWALFTR